MDVIRLRPGQNGFTEFKHPLLDQADTYKLTDEEFAEAGRDEKILSKLWLIRRLVGGYLHHWPICEPWLDDMVSTGLLTVTETEDLNDTRVLLNRLRKTIETMLSDNRSLVRGSYSTNIRLKRRGKDLEYAEMEPLRNIGAEDSDLQQFELLDQLTPEDRETYLDGI